MNYLNDVNYKDYINKHEQIYRIIKRENYSVG